MQTLNAIQIEREITALLSDFPELAEDEALRADVIEGQTGATAVLSRVVNRMHEAEMMAAAVAKRISDLQTRLSFFERIAVAMRALAMRIMEAANLRRMMLPEATLSIRVTPPAVIISDESQIPAEFVRTKTIPDRARIKEALQSGAHVPGAALSNGGASLSVRIK